MSSSASSRLYNSRANNLSLSPGIGGEFVLFSIFCFFVFSDLSSRSLNAFIWLNAYKTNSSQSFSLWPSLFLPLGHFGPCHCSTLTSRPAPVPRQRAVVLHMFAPGLCLLSCTSLCTAPLIRSACPVSFFPFALCSLSAARRPKALWRELWRRRGRQMGRGPGGPTTSPSHPPMQSLYHSPIPFPTSPILTDPLQAISVLQERFLYFRSDFRTTKGISVLQKRFQYHRSDFGIPEAISLLRD